MSNLSKITVIKLNSAWMPIGFTSVKKALPDMAAGTSVGLHLAFELGEDGEYNFDAPSETWPVKWSDWIELPVRDYDDFIMTPSRKIRIPRVVLCGHSGMPTVSPKLTKKAIFERDGYQCQYTGDRFEPHEADRYLNIDHVVPRAQGGKSTWDNLVASRKDINTKKDRLTPAQAGLKLRKKPTKPSSRPIASSLYKCDPDKVDRQWRWLLKGQEP